MADLKPIKDTTPDGGVVRILEQLLDDARSGDLRGIAFVGLFKSKKCCDGYRGERSPYLVAGMLEELKLQLLARVDRDPRQVVFSDEYPGG